MDEADEFAIRVAVALAEARELGLQLTAMRDRAQLLLRKVTVMKLKVAAIQAAKAARNLG
jgi:hypothetical protein